MSPRLLYILSLAFVIGGSSLTAALSQQGRSSHAPAAADEPYVIHQDVDEVLLYCTVKDGKGHVLLGLDRSSFSVLEDGKPVKITHFAQKDVPVSLALVLDDSASMKDKRSEVQSSALNLIEGSNPEDEASLTNFADKAYVDQPLTKDVALLKQALNKSETVSGGTAMFDTLISSADSLSATAHYGKQVIVIVTDGRDNASEADLATAIKRVQRTDGPVVYAIGLLYDVPTSDQHRARKELSALADETGGIAYFPASTAEVNQVATDVARDIRSQYNVSFHPLPGAEPGSYHTVALRAEVKGAGKVSVRTRKGYVRVVHNSISDAGSKHETRDR